ncbi:hypothetical protein D3C87_1435760 [compost metagenome]
MNNQVDLLLQTIFNLLRVGLGKIAARQHQRRGQHRLAERFKQHLRNRVRRYAHPDGFTFFLQQSARDFLSAFQNESIVARRVVFD